jgi:hypothetical protein
MIYKNIKDIHILLLTLVVLFFLKIFTHGVEIGLGGDELIKWSLANDFVFFQSNVSFTHHEMRWGHWIQTKPFTLIFDDFWGYYLSALIPMTLGLFIMSLSILRLGGLLPSILFLIITNFDSSLLNISFKLLPSNGTVLPLSILILILLKDNFKIAEFKNIVILLLLSIWLYGIKETNVFFLPGIAYVILKQAGLKSFIQYASLFLSFYIIETIMLLYHAEGSMSIFGRFYQLFQIGNEYIFESMSIKNSAIFNIQSQVNKWTNSVNSYIYITLMFILINNFILLKKIPNLYANLNFSYPIISFMAISTFMVGQGFIERYWFILIPIFYGNLILLLCMYFRNLDNFIRAFIIILFIALFNNSVINNIHKSIYKPNSLIQIIDTYQFVQDKILIYDGTTGNSNCTIINFNKPASYAVAYYFFTGIMRVHNHHPYKISKEEAEGSNKYKYGWKLKLGDVCSKNLILNMQKINKGQFKLIPFE